MHVHFTFLNISNLSNLNYVAKKVLGTAKLPACGQEMLSIDLSALIYSRMMPILQDQMEP